MLNASKNMYEIKLSVDIDLNILSVDTTLENIYKRVGCDLVGIPYHEIMPELKKDGIDAVKNVIDTGIPIELKEYKIPCLCGLSRADISILPKKDCNKEIAGAEITINVDSECIMTNAINESKILIDIGKTSTTLAHGIRSPLNAIKGAIVYLDSKYDSDPIFREFSLIIEDEINRLDRFVTKFLSGSLTDKETSVVDINYLLEEILKMLILHAGSKKIKFKKIFENVPPVKVEPFQFKHAILNILNNSIEATQDEGIISINTYVGHFKNKEFVTIQISDTGYGISWIDESKGLKEESVKRGKGFGLFITHEIVKNLGGYLEIKSKKMVGTTININIPAENSRRWKRD